MKLVKITSKYQTTVPVDIRKKLNLKIGDMLAFEYIEGNVIIKKIEPLDKAYLRAVADTLQEWNSKEDEEAYRALQDL